MAPSSAHVIPSAIQKTSVANWCFLRRKTYGVIVLEVAENATASFDDPEAGESADYLIPTERR